MPSPLRSLGSLQRRNDDTVPSERSAVKNSGSLTSRWRQQADSLMIAMLDADIGGEDEAEVSVVQLLVTTVEHAEGLEVANQIARLRSARAVVEHMTAHPSSVEVQLSGIRTLTEIRSSDESAAQAVFSAGGVQAIIAAMRAHFDSDGLQLEGTRALRFGSARYVVKCGGISAVLAAMRRHLQCAEVQRQGARTLAWISSFGDTAGADAIVRQGGVEVVVAGMRAHPENEVGQLEGMDALGHILKWGGKNGANAVVDRGGVEAMAGALKLHPDEATKEKATEALVSAYHTLFQA